MMGAAGNTTTTGTPGPVMMVDVARIHLKTEWQVRAKTDPTVARGYADAMGVGADFPPVHLAEIEGVYWLVDGWHRLAATKHRGGATIKATVVTLDPDEARWLAVVPNLRHGLPFKRAERRGVFKAFVSGKQHRRGRRYKTSREIARDLNGIASHTTILKWMRQDFPSVYAKMTVGEDELAGGDFDAKGQHEEALAEAARGYLGQLQGAFGDLRSPARRGELIAEAEAALSAMREAGGWTPSPPSVLADDF